MNCFAAQYASSVPFLTPTRGARLRAHSRNWLREPIHGRYPPVREEISSSSWSAWFVEQRHGWKRCHERGERVRRAPALGRGGRVDHAPRRVGEAHCLSPGRTAAAVGRGG